MSSPLADSYGIRSAVAEAARKLRPHAQGKDKFVVDGWSREEGARIPHSFLRLVEIACEAPLCDALAFLHALEREVVRRAIRADALPPLPVALVDDVRADNLGDEALARYANDRTLSSLEQFADATMAEKLSATVLAARLDVEVAKSRTGRLTLSLAR